MTDKNALRAIKRRDEKALVFLIDRYSAYVSTIIYNIIGNTMSKEDIEEITSDVFFILWQNANKPHEQKLKAWLGAVARNKAKNKLREFIGTLPLEDDVINENIINPETKIIEHEERNLLHQAISMMEYPDDEIFLRHYYHIQTVSEIAQDMNIGLSAVKARLSRGREKLRMSLEKGGYIK